MASEPFADLRRKNAYAARVARLMEARGRRRIERGIQVQRKHRSEIPVIRQLCSTGYSDSPRKQKAAK